MTTNLTSVDYDPFAGGEVVSTVPATRAQQEIWASAQMQREASLAYNESTSIRLRGTLDLGRLNRALARIFERHGALRATFSADGTSLCIATGKPVTLPLEDWSSLSPEAREKRLAEARLAEVETPLDLINGPLVRMRLVRLQPEEHVFFFTGHHIIFDGWSSAVVLDELDALYSGRDLPPSFPFATYAREDAGADADEAYWLQRLDPLPAPLDVPTDRPRPRLRTFTAEREDVVVSDALVADLRKMGAQHGASLVATFLAAFAAFLYRLTGQEDLVVGVPAAGQARVGQDRLVGHCVSLLPVRISVKPEQSFSDLLRSVRATFLDAIEHQRTTFGQLLAKLKLVRDPARIPLVPVVFNLDQGLGNFRFDGLDLTYASHPRTCETFELFINGTRATGQFVLETQYNVNLFDRETIRRRLAEFQTLLGAVARSPQQAVIDLPLLPEEERRRVLVEFNQTATDFGPPGCLHQLFERQVDLAPDRVALVYEGKSLSYAELDRRANQLAHRLLRLGVKPNTCVAVFAERSLEMVVAIYGILKAGGAYLPLEPSDPRDRLSFVLQDAAPVAIVAQAAVASRLPPSSIPVVELDADNAAIAQEPTTRPAAEVQPDDLAYVIFTSGSTGRPKGVGNRHRGIRNRILWHSACFGSPRDERILQKTPFTFDVSVWELFWPLADGGRLVVAPPRAHQDPARLSELIQSAGITTIHFVPSMLAAFLEHADLSHCSSLRRVVTSGEALPYELQERFFQRLPAELHNLYGPTEAAVDVTHWACRRGDPLGLVPIGKPVANTQIYILDSRMQPTPIGVPGELYIGGVQVAKGYLGRPELNARHFVPDPFANDPAARLYRTGDRARFLPSGDVDFLGRLDGQVKVRGLRIELEEIETVLADHPSIQKAAVRVHEVKAGDVRIVAFYVPAPGADVQVTELRKHLRARLPDYMVPQSFVAIDKVPLTTSGKTDRKALVVPSDGPAGGADRVAPRTPTEKVLVEMWAELLGTPAERISATDNFFDLGGHSLLALQAVARVSTRLGRRLEPRVMILNTLEQIAEGLAGPAAAQSEA